MSMHCWVLILLCAVLCCGKAEAGNVHGHGRPLEIQTELLFDSSPPPAPRAMLSKRDHEHHSSRHTGPNELQLDDAGAQTTLPRPFDTNIGNNFTTSTCPTFFDDFLNNQTFIDCHPFSLLLQTSNSFFSATHSLPRLTQTLNATCSIPSYLHCAALMSHLATQLTLPSACAADLALGNPTVTQAQAGLLAYPLYHAACLKNRADGSYCFAAAVTNASAPASSYIYYLPLGVALPGGAQVSCDGCLARTMAVFASWAGDEKQPLHEDFGDAAELVDMSCGPNFVEVSGPVVTATGVGRLRVGGGGGWWWWVALVAGVGWAWM